MNKYNVTSPQKPVATMLAERVSFENVETIFIETISITILYLMHMCM